MANELEQLRKEYLQIAMDERKLEIEMYWKRAQYFWALIAVAFGGYFTASSGHVHSLWKHFVIACLGLAFSVAWYCVNVGSAHWEKLWLNEVRRLEDKWQGPHIRIKSSLNRSYSAKKINELLSLFVICVWGLFVIYAGFGLFCPCRMNCLVSGIVVVLTSVFITLFLTVGKSDQNAK